MTRREQRFLMPVLDGPGREAGLYRIVCFDGRGKWTFSAGPMSKDEARRRMRTYRRRSKEEK